MQLCQGLWQGGYRGAYIEELISHAFLDFAPYAGADHQRIQLARQLGPQGLTSAAVVVEEGGDFTVRSTLADAGSVLFSTTGQLEAQVQARLPLRPIAREPATPATHEKKETQPSVQPSGPLGRVELSGPLPNFVAGRHSYGVRLGSLAARLVSMPTDLPKTSPTASSSDVEGETSTHTLYELDASWCLPLWSADQPVVAGRPLAAPWSLTASVQHPLTSGDTLLALALQSDRCDVIERDADILLPSRAALDPTALYPRFPALHEASLPMAAARPSSSFRLLLVQTLNSRYLVPSDSAITTPSASPSRLTGYALESSRKPWFELGTLLGLRISLWHDLLRVSLASIVHDREVDVEASAVLDATPWLPRTPTLLKLGWNQAGRLGLGITSSIYSALEVTLGVHVMPQEEMRFGLEIKM